MSAMAKRAPSSDNEDDENPAKRTRLDREASSAAEEHSLSLVNLNDNCLLCMMSNLTHHDLNSLAMCNRQLRQLRNHESLDQTRTATIVCRRHPEMFSFLRSVEAKDWSGEITGNKTHLKIERIARIGETDLSASPSDEFRPLATRMAFQNVQSLDLTLPRRKEIPFSTFNYLFHLFPCLRSVDLSDITAPSGTLRPVCAVSPYLHKVSWNGARLGIFFDGYLLHLATELTELYIDDCQFIQDVDTVALLDAEDTDLPVEDRLLCCCKSLERVSMKNASYSDNHREPVFFPVTQEMLIKFVRNKSTLRWFRSDLTEANIAMLQQERPEVTFVSD